MVNNRMNVAGNKFSWEIVEVLKAGDVVKFYFTYHVQNTDCDTEMFTFTVPGAKPKEIQLPPAQPAPAQAPVQEHVTQTPSKLACPVLTYLTDFDIGCITIDPLSHYYKILFTMKNQLLLPDWIDVHFQVNGGQVQNHRMGSIGNGGFSHEILDVPGLVSMNAGDVVQFFFTYCVQMTDCDTDLFSFTVPPFTQTC